MAAVQEALKRALVPEGDLDEITVEAEMLAKKSKGLLPVETHVKEAIKERMKELKLQSDRVAFHTETGLQMIPLDVLTWRVLQKVPGLFGSTVKLPQLALIPVEEDNPSMRFNGYNLHDPGYPKRVSQCWFDVMNSIGHAGGEDNRVSAVFTYTGAIPDDVRQKIHDTIASKVFHTSLAPHPVMNQQLYLLCEATPWKVDTKKIPKPSFLQRIDPLVVGYAHEALWLVDQFDPTAIEEYIAIEFASRPALAAGPDTV